MPGARRLIGQRRVGPARLTFEVGPLFDRQALVIDVTLDMGLGLKAYTKTPDRPQDLAADDDILGDDGAVDLCLVAQKKRAAMDVALDLTVHLNLTL